MDKASALQNCYISAKLTDFFYRYKLFGKFNQNHPVLLANIISTNTIRIHYFQIRNILAKYYFEALEKINTFVEKFHGTGEKTYIH